MAKQMSKRGVVAGLVLSTVLALNVGTSNAGIIGYGLTSGSRGIDLLVVSNVFSPKLADFMLRAGWLS